MRGTKLFQQAQSPLIQGRSRSEHAFWRDWVLAALWGLLAGLGIGMFLASSAGQGIVGGALAGMLVAVPAAVLASALGVWVARAWGSRRPVIVGAALAVVLSVATVWILNTISV